jgi:predicted permease
MVIAVLVLALAMTAGTVALSVVDTVVLRPLPFDKSEELAALVVSPSSPTLWQPVSGPEVIAWSSALDSLDSWAAVASGSEVLQLSGERTRVVSARVTASLFNVLRSRPAAGRLFTESDESRANGAVAIISYELWQKMFGGHSGAVGAVLNLAEGSATVVGVLERNGGYPIATTAGTGPELWTLLDLPKEGPYLRLLARARPEVSLSVVAQRLRRASQVLIQADPVRYERWTPTFVPLYDVVVGPVRSWMLLLLISVGLLLLVACVNMANVLLIRSTSRAGELAIRAALGASRRRLAFELFRENALLSAAPISIALVAALWGIAAAKAALPGGIARTGLIALDSRVLAAALGVGLVTILIFGVVPVLHARSSDLAASLRKGNRAPGGRRWRSAFLISEISLVSVLSVATALFLGSFLSATRADLGFNRTGLVEVMPAGLGIPAEEVIRRLESVPGVASVALYRGNGFLLDLMVGRGVDTGGQQLTTVDGLSGLMVDRRQVASGFFSTAGVRFASGRPFGDDDALRASVVIDDAAARMLFGDQDPIGRQVRFLDSKVPMTIVGITRQVKREGPEKTPRRPLVFEPIGPDTPAGAPGFLVRLSRPVDVVSASIQDALAQGSGSGRSALIVPLETTFARFTAPRRFAASLMALIGGIAVLIGAAGVYAVMSILLSQQTYEFGVRAALGETPGQLARRVLLTAAKHLVIGLAVGLTVAWWASRGFSGLFFGVRPSDLSVYLTVAGVITVAGIVACIPVARRAAQVDPMKTLRAME